MRVEVIPNRPEKFSNIEKYIDCYNCNRITFSTGLKYWEKFEKKKNNPSVTLNILHIYEKDDGKIIKLMDIM